MKRIGRLIQTFILVGIGWLSLTGSAHADIIPSQNWGPGMIMYVEFYCKVSGWVGTSTKNITQAYEDGDVYWTTDNTTAASTFCAGQEITSGTYAGRPTCVRPIAATFPVTNDVPVNAVYGYETTPCTQTWHGSIGAGEVGRAVCPVGWTPNLVEETCSDTPPSCGDYEGQSMQLTSEGSYRFQTVECHEIATDFFCTVERSESNRGMSITVETATGVTETYGGEYVVSENSLNCGVSEEYPMTNEISESEQLGPAPEGCIVGSTGQKVCLEEEGGSEMIAVNEAGEEIATPNNSICLETNGSFQCFETEEQQTGCGHVNGEYNCYNPEGVPIPPTDPDHPDNGGNGDGDSTNDLLNPEDPGDSLTEGEQNAIQAEQIGDAVSEGIEEGVKNAIGDSLDGTVKEEELEQLEESFTAGLPRDSETGELITQEKEAEDIITDMGDYINFIDPSAERLRIKSEVQQVFGFDDPTCRNIDEVIFASTGLGSVHLKMDCSDTETFRTIMKYVLWLGLVVYLFVRVTTFTMKAD